MATQRVVVIGAGIGGLTSALLLAARGLDVTVIEQAEAPGGKVREVPVGKARVDAGPTVFTMRWVFDEILAEAGTTLDALVGLHPCETLARHAWSGTERLDLHADLERSVDAIGSFAGAREANGYRRFCERARRSYETLEKPFIRNACAGPQDLIRSGGLKGLAGLWRVAPFSTMMGALEEYFRDPRLLQLFGRYATYCGSSPYQASASLLLVAHVEREGVWLVEGGMHRLAAALADLARQRGARFRYGNAVAEIDAAKKQVRGVTLASGEYLEADAVIFNGDVAALANGLLGPRVSKAIAPQPRNQRSLSAVTWIMHAETSGFPLLRHNVFFSADYPAEFADLFRHQRLPRQPTVYVCAQDRNDEDQADDRSIGPERLLCLVNAPAVGDQPGRSTVLGPSEITRCEQQTFNLLKRCGLNVNRHSAHSEINTPATFNRLFPGTGGAIYGPVSHGWKASFRRPGSRTAIQGLYLAGGSTHPGPGVPMAALSGRLAANALLDDLVSTARSKRAATSGGISMPSATTDSTR